MSSYKPPAYVTMFKNGTDIRRGHGGLTARVLKASVMRVGDLLVVLMEPGTV